MLCKVGVDVTEKFEVVKALNCVGYVKINANLLLYASIYGFDLNSLGTLVCELAGTEVAPILENILVFNLEPVGYFKLNLGNAGLVLLSRVVSI